MKTKGRIAYLLYQTEAGRDRYRKTLHGLLKEHWNEEELLAECDRIEALIEPHLNREQSRFSRALRGTREFIRERREDLMDETGEAMPRWTKTPKAPPVIAEIGNVKAKFYGEWMEESPREQTNLGKAMLQLTLNDKPVELTDVGVHGAWAGGGFGRSNKPTIRFSGRRKSDGKSVSVDISIPEDKFKPADAIESGGVFKEGRGFSFGPLGMQFINGKAKLTKASLEEGDQFEGEFEGTILKLIGMGR